VAGQGRLTPGWIGWLAIELIWLLAVAIVRDGGATGTWVGVLQLFPTLALVLELAALLELASGEFGPSAATTPAEQRSPWPWCPRWTRRRLATSRWSS